MTEKELRSYLLDRGPKENESCDWKEMRNLNYSFSGDDRSEGLIIADRERYWRLI